MADPVLIHVGNAEIAGNRYGVAPADILGILSVEGGTGPDGKPVAPADGMGPPSYGQFIYSTGASLGVKYGDSASETDAIARYLVKLGYKTDRARAIAAYNGGPANPQYDYAAKVIAAAKRYLGAKGGSATVNTGGTTTGNVGDTDGLGESLLRGLVWTGLVGAGTILAALGIGRALGVRTPAGAPA